MRPRWKDGPEFLFRFNGWHRAAWRRSRVPGSTVVQWIWLGQQGDFTHHLAWSFDPSETWLALHTGDRQAVRKCILLLSSLWFCSSSLTQRLYMFLEATSLRTLNDNVHIEKKNVFQNWAKLVHLLAVSRRQWQLPDHFRFQPPVPVLLRSRPLHFHFTWQFILPRDPVYGHQACLWSWVGDALRGYLLK